MRASRHDPDVLRLLIGVTGNPCDRFARHSPDNPPRRTSNELWHISLRQWHNFVAGTVARPPPPGLRLALCLAHSSREPARRLPRQERGGRMIEADRNGDGRLIVLLAQARERLADAWLVHALDFIQRTSGDIEAPRALDVFCRLHHIDELDARNLKNRVLASFGRVTMEASEGMVPTFEAVGGELEWDVTASVFYRLRRRLGGRRNNRLRRWIELHTGWVEGRLLKVHAENVLRLLEVNGTSSGGVADTIHHYVRSLRIRESLLEAIRIAVCDMMFPDVTSGRRPMLVEDPVVVDSEEELESAS